MIVFASEVVILPYKSVFHDDVGGALAHCSTAVTGQLFFQNSGGRDIAGRRCRSLRLSHRPEYPSGASAKAYTLLHACSETNVSKICMTSKSAACRSKHRATSSIHSLWSVSLCPNSRCLLLTLFGWRGDWWVRRRRGARHSIGRRLAALAGFTGIILRVGEETEFMFSLQEHSNMTIYRIDIEAVTP